ncbi:MAG: type II toxin-antitoxin system VapC family toxin [Deltaproteobacteria bacterium]|nr:type II toxin-antitoxin system VapC family toxin [Deltaproteobacteria bacterium]
MIVLDTNAWVFWAADPKRLSRRALRRIQREEAGGEILVSVVSAWEVALKHSLGKLELDRDVASWIAVAAGYPRVRLVPLEVDEAVQSTSLPGSFHRDPADRFIVALARRLGVPIVTSDKRIRKYAHVQSVW